MFNYGDSVGKDTPEWPYPVNYGKENEASADVLVLGGGIAGCHAAINAARRGAKVAVVEIGATKRSGSGGAGVDHWGAALTNPLSTITPDQIVERPARQDTAPEFNGITRYITMMESWDTLLDCEKMGLQFRDIDDEFAGAPFRDEKTKIMFAYDYKNKNNIRIRGGAKIKVYLYRELRKLGVQIYDRTMATSLLTEGGRQGARVIGATGVNIRTGEFYIFKAKATVLTTAHFSRIWVFSTELVGSAVDHDDPNCIGDGSAAAWRAGAIFTHMERSRGPVAGGFGWPRFGIGSPTNSWYPCNLVDANGKPIPWIDGYGNPINFSVQRCRDEVRCDVVDPKPVAKFQQPNQPSPDTAEVDPMTDAVISLHRAVPEFAGGEYPVAEIERIARVFLNQVYPEFKTIEPTLTFDPGMKGNRLNNGNYFFRWNHEKIELPDGLTVEVTPFVQVGITAGGFIFGYDNTIPLYQNSVANLDR